MRSRLGILVLGAAATSIALGGCGHKSTAEKVMDQVHEKVPAATVSSKQVLSFARTVCRKADSGDVGPFIAGWVYTHSDWSHANAKAMGAGVHAMCPDKATKINKQLSAIGDDG